MSELRNQKPIRNVLEQIKTNLNDISDQFSSSTPLTIMHVCGTHEDTLMKNGLRFLLDIELNKRIRMVAGPGCPVCVSPVQDIDFAVALSNLPNTIITSFGDMVRVPGSTRSLEMQRQKGKQIITVYSIIDAIKLAKEKPNKTVIFISPGFETTTPATAIEILNNPPENFFVLASHRLVPPALDVLMTLPELALNGFILPGHVSVIIGEKAYLPFVNKWKISSVIAGFEPLDMLSGILAVVKQIQSSNPRLENVYERAVSYSGNEIALNSIYTVFKVEDSIWRGLGVFPSSGLEIKEEFSEYNARTQFIDKLDLEIPQEIPKGCQCHRVVIGVIEPETCPLYMTKCTPEKPVGPCMVGFEGTCRIRAIFG
jgi:hydrogenase expression/formation protein HypD